MNECNLIHTVSDYEKNLLIKKMKITSIHKIKTIPLFIETSKRLNNDTLELNSKKLREQLDIRSDEIIILGIGDSRKEAKGVEYTIQALNKLSKDHSNICLITIGSNFTLNDFNLKPEFKFINLGFVSVDIKETLFYTCDIFCMPSLVESFGLVYLEAWAKKKPVVGFKLGALSEILSGGSLLSESKNIYSLAKNIESLIISPNKRLIIGERGYESLNKNYASKKAIEMYKDSFLS
jgi:glycosyltransferase involved in cell wall biosynthesis